MISILYGSLGAATGIAQGLFRGAFETLPVPARAHGAVNASKHSATEIAADCVGKQPASAGQPVLLLPLVVVGHARVGKTSLLNTYLHGRELRSPEPTLGADLSVKQLWVQQQHVSLQIWDTAGEVQADLLDSRFWSNASGAVMVCNLHQASCTTCLDFWKNKLSNQDGLPFVVIAVKHGLSKLFNPENAEREEQLVAEWCQHHEICMFTMGAACDHALAEKAFEALIEQALVYQEKRAESIFKPFNVQEYPALFLLQTDGTLDLARLLN